MVFDRYEKNSKTRSSDFLDYGIVGELHYVNKNGEDEILKDMKESASTTASATATPGGDVESAWYSFGNYGRHQGNFPLKFNKTGHFVIAVSVIDDSSAAPHTLFTKDFKVVVEAKIAADFEFEFTEDRRTVMLGDYLPAFNIQFVDASKNPVTFEGHVQIRLHNPILQTYCEEYINPVFHMTEEDKGLLPFEGEVEQNMFIFFMNYCRESMDDQDNYATLLSC